MVTKREVQLVIAQLIEQVGVLLKFSEELDRRVKVLESPKTEAPVENQE